jgi:hypothetical protein
MRQAPPCEIRVTRSFFEVLSRVAPERAERLKYQGLLTDTCGRPLAWYALDPVRDAHAMERAGEASGKSADGAQERVRPGRWNPRVLLRAALLPALAVAIALAWRPLQAPEVMLPGVSVSEGALDGSRALPVSSLEAGPGSEDVEDAPEMLPTVAIPPVPRAERTVEPMHKSAARARSGSAKPATAERRKAVAPVVAAPMRDAPPPADSLFHPETTGDRAAITFSGRAGRPDLAARGPGSPAGEPVVVR